MNTSLAKSLWLLLFSIILCCGLFPLVIWALGQGLFHREANGSLIYQHHTAVASGLIAQPFARPEYFHPRPSATGYNTEASSASSLAPSNPALRRRIVDTLEQLAKEGLSPKDGPVPADAVMASASGLDPDISLDYANRQLERVTRGWAARLGKAPDALRPRMVELLRQHTHAPLSGLAGPPVVNTTTLNASLGDAFLEPTHG